MVEPLIPTLVPLFGADIRKTFCNLMLRPHPCEPVPLAADKYLHTTEDSTMPQLIEPTTPEAQREVIQQSLEEIAAEVGTALREAHLDFPVFLTVPNSGESLATMACPLDPSDADWAHASVIVCRIIGQRLGDARLSGRPLHCAVANATMGATDVIPEAASEA